MLNSYISNQLKTSQFLFQKSFTLILQALDFYNTSYPGNYRFSFAGYFNTLGLFVHKSKHIVNIGKENIFKAKIKFVKKSKYK